MCLVDACNFLATLQDPSTHRAAEMQLIFADKILINKVDQASEEIISQIRAEIANLNTNAEIRTCSYADADLKYLTE